MKQPAQVTVVSGNRALRRNLVRAVAAIGCDVFIVDTSDEKATVPTSRVTSDLYLIDVEHLNRPLPEFIAAISQRTPPPAMLLIANHGIETNVYDVMTTYPVNHVVSFCIDSAGHRLINENELIVTCKKLISDDIFGFEKYFRTWGIQVHQHTVKSKEDKRDAIDALELFLGRIDCYPSLVPSISTAADELIMNAIFSAPRTSTGDAPYQKCDRSHPIALGDHEAATFFYACDGWDVFIAVTDRFGSLSRETILKHVEPCFRREKANIRSGSGGAGIGLYVVFNTANQLTFNLHESVCTEVIASFYVRGGARDLRTSGRSLNLFFS